MHQYLATSSRDSDSAAAQNKNFGVFFLSRIPRINGFTLIEILVALAILAVVSTTVMRQMSNSSAQISNMEKRTFARMVAQNKLTETKLGLSSADDFQFAEAFAGHHWQVQIAEEEIAESSAIRLEVLVYEEDQLDTPFYRLVGYERQP